MGISINGCYCGNQSFVIMEIGSNRLYVKFVFDGVGLVVGFWLMFCEVYVQCGESIRLIYDVFQVYIMLFNYFVVYFYNVDCVWIILVFVIEIVQVEFDENFNIEIY